MDAETLTRILDAAEQRQGKAIRHARELVARYHVLATYDAERHMRRHDYGGGQRAGELNRLRRQAEAAVKAAQNEYATPAMARTAIAELELPLTVEVEAALEELRQRVAKNVERGGQDAGRRALAAFTATTSARYPTPTVYAVLEEYHR